jgi:hypothetical protein
LEQGDIRKSSPWICTIKDLEGAERAIALCDTCERMRLRNRPAQLAHAELLMPGQPSGFKWPESKG